MDNNSRPTWERARSLKTYIREKGCKEYEELVALRAEVNTPLWFLSEIAADAEDDFVALYRRAIEEKLWV
jgi:hypothetical protein